MAQPNDDHPPEIKLLRTPWHASTTEQGEYTGPPGTVLDVDVDPGADFQVTVGANGKFDVPVPAGAGSIIVSDPSSGGAAAVSTTFGP
jgi:hypothetical protein